MANKLFTAYTDETEILSSDSFIVTDESIPAVRNITAADLFSSVGLAKNISMNYPSIEGASGQPQWWDVSNATLREKSAAALGISDAPNDIILEGEVSASNGYFYQQYTIADENHVNVNSVLTLSCWVYIPEAGPTVTIRLYDDSGGSLGTDSTWLSQRWVFLSVTATVDGSATTVQIRFESSQNATVFYVANPMLNAGSTACPFRPRDLVYHHIIGLTNPINGVDPGGTSTTIDATSSSSNLTAMLDLQVLYRNTTTAGSSYYISPYGTVGSDQQDLANTAYDANAAFQTVEFPVICDDQQRVVGNSDAAAGDSELVYVCLRGYWEWD